MVTLKINFGVEPDKDKVVMNASEGSNNDAKSSLSGHPRAVLICRRNSHPFQARTLILNTPAKIGRSVARARPSTYNGIFDCKVLSRNHAIIWYEYDTGKFMIQDTKSSNGTFVNNQRLSKGGETSLPKEFFSRDTVQFGVNVLENQRKGNEESEKSDENNHIVTHGCIIATVKLFHPNGKESKSGQSFSHQPPSPIPQEKICKLELIIHEAQQREERLHDKLEELQLIIGKLEVACQEALTNRFEETRLLSKIENLEKQAKVMSKVKPGGPGKAPEKVEAEIHQLLVDIEKIQSVGREIQERQHRKLLESEQKLVEAQRVASNLELEVIALREQASLSESHLQEMGAKCTAYCQTIETLQNSFHAQIELIQKLENQVREFQESERDYTVDFSKPNKIDKYRFISENSEEEEDSYKKDSQEVILEWCKNYEELYKIEEKEFINENDKTEWLTKKLDNLAEAKCSGLKHISNCIGQLESSLLDVQLSKIKLDKLYGRKRELALKLDLARMPIEENEKTEEDLDGEHHELAKPVILLSNEKISELENELKEQEDLLSEAELHLQESEAKRTKLRRELDATVKRCEKLTQESCNVKNLLRNHMKCFEESMSLYRQKILKLESEVEELENGNEQKWLEILGYKSKSTEVKETQTSSVTLTCSATNTENVENENTMSPDSNKENSKQLEFQKNEEQFAKEQSALLEMSHNATDLTDGPKLKFHSLDNLQSESEEKNTLTKIVEKEMHFEKDALGEKIEFPSTNLGAWDKIRKIQDLLILEQTNDLCFSHLQINEMRNLMNLLAEDLVHLLLREQQMSKDKQNLQDKLDRSISQTEISALGLAMHLRTIMLFSVTAIAAYLIYSVFL